MLFNVFVFGLTGAKNLISNPLRKQVYWFGTETTRSFAQRTQTCHANQGHSVLSKLPKGDSKKPELMQSSWFFRQHLRGPDMPQYIEDWLYEDIPSWQSTSSPSMMRLF
jgi:hypothetical protein